MKISIKTSSKFMLIFTAFAFMVILNACIVEAAKPDLAITNYESGTLSSAVNVDGSSFDHLSPDLPIGNRPNSMDQGDFNGDNILDLVVGNGDSGGDRSVTFAFGKGDGTFINKGSFFLGFEPSGVAAGDFNNDGHLDVFASNWSGSGGAAVQVLLWDGSGIVSHINALPQVPVAVGSNGGTVADFNEDGFLDATVTNWNSSLVTVLFGDGTGALTPDTVLGANTRPQNIQTGDLNNDGSVDIAFAHGNSSFVTYYLGTGTKNFAPRKDVPVSGDPGTGNLLLGDFNNDGFEDIVTPGIFGNTVYLNVMFWDDLSGQINSAQHNSLIEGYPESMKAADFNLDGNLDVAVSNRSANKVSIYYGNGAGNLGNRVDIPGSLVGPLGLAVGNFDLPTPKESIQELISDINSIIPTVPTQVATKLGQAVEKFNAALFLLGQANPDFVEISNQIKSAASAIEQAVDKGLDPSLGQTLMDESAGVARLLAEKVINAAIANGTAEEIIAQAQAFVAEGDALRVSGNYVDAIKSYRKAIQRV